MRDEHEEAKGTDREPVAESSLRTADDQVRARERWLQTVDDHDD